MRSGQVATSQIVASPQISQLPRVTAPAVEIFWEKRLAVTEIREAMLARRRPILRCYEEHIRQAVPDVIGYKPMIMDAICLP